jgi:hypothetical protein
MPKVCPPARRIRQAGLRRGPARASVHCSLITALSHLQRIRLAHVRQKPRMCRPALGKVRPRLAQAQPSVHREPYIGGVLILLPVVLPPAHRAQLQRLRPRQRTVPATWTAILVSHVQVDGFPHPSDYAPSRRNPTLRPAAPRPFYATPMQELPDTCHIYPDCLLSMND